jgi:histidine decarboxylase
VPEVLAGLLQTLEQARGNNIGFPGATDLDNRELAPFLSTLLNNVGDPYVSGIAENHTKRFEIDVVEFLADVFGAPEDDRWGYVTTGGTEANLYALQLARDRHPNAVVYASQAAHGSVAKATHLLGMTKVTVRTTDSGELDYADLSGVVSLHRDRPAVVVATVGTTMTEAVDDVARIRQVLGYHAMEQFVHADAAMAGIPRALDTVGVGVDLGPTGADSVCVSGHKFLGSPVPCAVVVTRRSLYQRLIRPGSYTASPDTTITGSRSGLAPLILWYRLHQLGWRDGLRKRADRCRDLAEYAEKRLRDIGWEAWRNPRAFTVVIRTPPAAVRAKWILATHDGWSHLVCMPGVVREQIDGFVDALHATTGRKRSRRLTAPASR